MPFSSSAFPPAPYHPMAAGRKAVRRSPFGSSSPASCPCGIALAPCRLFDWMRRGGRRGDWLLMYRGVVHHVSSIDVYNEYDVCDVYKRYKDTRIREYDRYIWNDADRTMAMSCSKLGDETGGRVRPDEQDPTGRYNEYGKN